MNPNKLTDKLATINTTVHLTDDRQVDVHVRNPSLVAWDIARADKGWPKADDAPLLWLTFLCWDALCRQGDYDRGEGKATTFAKFRDEDCLLIDEPEDTDGEDPTKPAAEAGSASRSASEPASTGTSSRQPPTSS